MFGTMIEISCAIIITNMFFKRKKKAVELSGDNFHTTIKTGITLVDFWAPWCGPCRIQGPILNDVAEEIGENAVIAKLNVDDNQKIAATYSIRSIPSLILFRNGRPVKKFTGVQSKQTLINAINPLLS